MKDHRTNYDAKDKRSLVQQIRVLDMNHEKLDSYA